MEIRIDNEINLNAHRERAMYNLLKIINILSTSAKLKYRLEYNINNVEAEV